MRLRDAMTVASRIGGHGLPGLAMPTRLVRLGSHAPASLARALGCPTTSRGAAGGDGVTYWASSAKAATELGYAPRDLASGLRATFDGE